MSKPFKGGAVFTRTTGDVSTGDIAEFSSEDGGSLTVTLYNHDQITKTPVTINGGEIYMKNWPNWTLEAVARINCNGTVMEVGETKDFRSCYSIGNGLVWFMVDD